MTKQIGIKWDSVDGGDYAVSVAALKDYVPMPQIDASIRIKGSVPESVVAAFEEAEGQNQDGESHG